MTVARAAFTIRQRAGTIGAEIEGVTLSADLDAGAVDAIRTAVLTHKVLFLSGQHHLDDEQLVALAARFGDVTLGSAPRRLTVVNPIHKVDATDPAHVRANVWHTDHLYVERPASIEMLRAVAIPPIGGDTCWANTANAYRHLPPPLRDMADSMFVLHANEYEYDQLELRPDGTANEAVRSSMSSFVKYATIQPVVHVHPETGERCLLLGKHARYILDFSPKESASLLGIFQDRITRPENTVRWTWSEGDVVIWDNRSTQHYAVDDWGDAPRILHRVSVSGDIPVSVHGQLARQIEGDTSDYYEPTADPSSTAREHG